MALTNLLTIIYYGIFFALDYGVFFTFDIRKRDTLLGEYIGANCPQVAMDTETGKKRKTDICKYCKVVVSTHMINRWHNENCKLKK